ncbi:MAG: pantoate--beta-alanine ligase, partial [Deferribacterales bacterium]|nr:pantoate--beta-alanine ligase [Deferribacterales bacterium]
GKTRPVHFGGVATVVCKLFNIITPHRAYFGSKDFQQLCIIKKMVKDLNMDVEIVGMPIIRDIDGLALSSRNVYLNKNERIAALSLNRSLDLAEKLVKEGETDSAKIIKAAKEIIEEFNETKVDYICIADPDTLENKSDIVGQTIMLLAVYVGKARLIDNRLIKQ